jgi:L-asparaginase
MQIKIFTTGGSLDKGYSTVESAFVVQEQQAGALLEEANVHPDFAVEPLLRKDSLEITEEDRSLIRRRVEEDVARRILITHGTDTMADTARALKGIPGKTVVLTGAMQPAAFRNSDGPFNLGFALAATRLLPPGVYLAMNGRIFDPDRTVKNRDLDRFEELP